MSPAFPSRCYGVRLVSTAPIPGLASSGRREPDALAIELGADPDWSAPPGPDQVPPDAPLKVEWHDGRTALHYADGTRFHIDFTRPRIWASWLEPLTLEDTATYLLGPVLGHYLRRRGRLCLHASSAAIDGRCVAFVGPAGSGKSTLAAALAMTGAGILSEDVACLLQEGDGFIVQPGYPRIRLWSDAAPLLGIDARSLPLLTPNWDKRFLPLDGRAAFHDRPERLDAIFLLAPRRAIGAAAELEELPGAQALSALVANTYGTLLLDERQRQEEFAALGALCRAVPVRALTLNADGARLFEACDWIRRHALA